MNKINIMSPIDREAGKENRLQQLDNEAIEKANELLGDAWELAREIGTLRGEADQFNAVVDSLEDGYTAYRQTGPHQAIRIENCRGYDQGLEFEILWKIGEALELITAWAREKDNLEEA